MRQEERFGLILRELADSGSVSIADLAPAGANAGQRACRPACDLRTRR